MKKLLFFLLIAVCGCTSNSSHHGKTIEAVFHPAFVEDCSHLDFPIDYNNRFTALNFRITPSEYSYMADILRYKKIVSAKTLCGNKIKTIDNVKPPCVFIKLDTGKYVLGNNGIVKDSLNVFAISDLDVYRIKTILHYYNFFYEEDLWDFPEVRKYGIPANYHHQVLRKKNAPPPYFVRVMLKEK